MPSPPGVQGSLRGPPDGGRVGGGLSAAAQGGVPMSSGGPGWPLPGQRVGGGRRVVGGRRVADARGRVGRHLPVLRPLAPLLLVRHAHVVVVHCHRQRLRHTPIPSSSFISPLLTPVIIRMRDSLPKHTCSKESSLQLSWPWMPHASLEHR